MSASLDKNGVFYFEALAQDILLPYYILYVINMSYYILTQIIVKVVPVYLFRYERVPELTVHMFEASYTGLSLQHQTFMSSMLWWVQIKQNSSNGTFNLTS